MKTSGSCTDNKNVIDLFTGLPFGELDERKIVRLSPENDGLEMLYSNDANPDKLFSMKILCWALRSDGEAVGMVPWLDSIVACPDLTDPLKGHWEGYFDPGIDEVFNTPPLHKVVELETAAEYYEYECTDAKDIIQEIPDTIGTHAVLSNDGFETLILSEVISWRLHNDGTIHGMLINEAEVHMTPVLPGDPCLYPAQQHSDFKYFFQHQIANKIKSHDPEALAAISLLIDQ
jgi:hypothetical protein